MLSVTDMARRAMHRPPPVPDPDDLTLAATVLHRFAAEHEGHDPDGEDLAGRAATVCAFLLGLAETALIEADVDRLIESSGYDVGPETRALARVIVASTRRANRDAADGYRVTVPSAVATALSAPPACDPHGRRLDTDDTEGAA